MLLTVRLVKFARSVQANVVVVVFVVVVVQSVVAEVGEGERV